ncbi:aminotransferase-like domain-containing protein [Neogemmobacter tilapiae]|uniref:GntR family transcriptional regulator n=1 Tax=Neogemmobacter tilapiae TaxID=875041 RepID=A0A918TD83_9RHOB|nr:PLP-dependent aminotransferase family protein [Gemmobacter tilapiae]GHC43753.1 GntR family transcriptional regulator [Gemmobacter tilapiae]
MNTIWKPDLAQFDGPKFLALSRALRQAIQSGELSPGHKLPPVRDLAYDLGITPGTVARAYQVATQEGLLSATVGRGTFVAAASPRLGPTQPLYMDMGHLKGQGNFLDLRAPVVPDVGQAAVFSEILAEMSAKMQGEWFDYTSQRDEAPLRAEVVKWLSYRMLGSVTPEDIALTQGGQSAILTILLCCLRGDRPVVLTEELAYPGFRHAARLARADVIGVEMDDQGIIPEALEAVCRKTRAQVLCLTVVAQNPTAARMGAERRAAIAEIARRHDLQVIEDNCYATPEHDLPAMRALIPERCWYIGGFAKTISAALRFGYIVCPTGMGETARLTAQHSFFALSRPLHQMVLALLQSGEAHRIRKAVGAALAERAHALVNHLGAHDLGWQPGLPFMWVRLPSGWRASTFARMAEGQGVLLRSADEYALIHGRAPHAVRLAVNGSLSIAAIEEAGDRLASLLRSPPGESYV